MATRAFAYLFFVLLPLIVGSSGTCAEEVVFHSSQRELLNSFHYKATQHDLVDAPTTTNPITPVTNPVTTPVTNPVTTPGFVPPDNSAPTIITVPATNPNPVSTPPTIPSTNPIPVPGTNPVTPAVPVINPVTPAVPVTNPVTPAVPVTNPVTTPITNPLAQPVTNPVTTPTPSSGGVPVTTSPFTNPNQPPVTTNAPATPGQSWCVAKNGLQESQLQAALDYACGMGAADCSAIQQGGTCYNPNSLQYHASFAFNSYFQRNPTPTSCDFGGAAMITNTNPSTGSCVYPLLGTPSASPVTSSAPTTASTSGATLPGSGAPPTVVNAGIPIPNPGLGGTTAGFGESPQTATTSTSSKATRLQYLGCITIVATILTGMAITF